MKYFKKVSFLLTVSLMLSLIGCGSQTAPATMSASQTLAVLETEIASNTVPLEKQEIKNVIFMLSDGTSVDVATLARWFKSYDGAGHFDTSVRLNVDPYVSGLIRTYWKDSDGAIGAITDSAPGGTAYAIGHKASNQALGKSADGKSRATLVELAKSLGKSTGLVATVHMQHATPAAFASHTIDREDYEDIASQMLQTDVDVVLGGGSRYLQNRADKRDLVAEIQAKGYHYLTTEKELAAFEGTRVYGMFAPYFMAYDIDRALLAPEEPTLEEMTKKSIEILSKNEKGFFLLVEGSKVDWGAHNNDPAAVISEFLAFDRSVGVAMEFAKNRSDTMVLVVEDHGTGGISIGSTTTDKNYSAFLLEDTIKPLSKAKITGNGAVELLAQGKSAEAVLALYGIEDPTTEELAWVRGLKPDAGGTTTESRAKFGAALSARSNVGWTTLGHTGEDVVLYSYLPGDKRLTGLFENTELTKVITDAWGTTMTDQACLHQ